MNELQSSFQHDEVTMPFTLARQTDIRMPTLGEEDTIYAALFVLDANASVKVSF